jgi:hypothetical protein
VITILIATAVTAVTAARTTVMAKLNVTFGDVFFNERMFCKFEFYIFDFLPQTSINSKGETTEYLSLGCTTSVLGITTLSITVNR